MRTVADRTEQQKILVVDDCTRCGQSLYPVARTSGETKYVSTIGIRHNLDIPQKEAGGVSRKTQHPAKSTPHFMKCPFCAERQFVLPQEGRGKSSSVIHFCDACMFG
jgi:hypothetical protein